MADERHSRPGGPAAAGRRPAAPTTDPGARRRVALKQERDDLYDRLLRKTAEFDNYRKRVERERREQADQARRRSAPGAPARRRRLRSRADGRGGDEPRRYRKGVELIHSQAARPAAQAGRHADRRARRRLRPEPPPGRRPRREPRRIARARSSANCGAATCWATACSARRW